jgi:hypothetical protein
MSCLRVLIGTRWIGGVEPASEPVALGIRNALLLATMAVALTAAAGDGFADIFKETLVGNEKPASRGGADMSGNSRNRAAVEQPAVSREAANHQQHLFGYPTHTDPLFDNGTRPDYPQEHFEKPSYDRPAYDPPNTNAPIFRLEQVQKPVYQMPLYVAPNDDKPAYNIKNYEAPGEIAPTTVKPDEHGPNYVIEPEYAPTVNRPAYVDPYLDRPEYDAPNYLPQEYQPPRELPPPLIATPE